MNHLQRLTPDSQQGPRDRGATLKYFVFLMWFQSGFEKDLKKNLIGSSLLRHYRKPQFQSNNSIPKKQISSSKKYLEKMVFLHPNCTTTPRPSKTPKKCSLGKDSLLLFKGNTLRHGLGDEFLHRTPLPAWVPLCGCLRHSPRCQHVQLLLCHPEATQPNENTELSSKKASSNLYPTDQAVQKRPRHFKYHPKQSSEIKK